MEGIKVFFLVTVVLGITTAADFPYCQAGDVVDSINTDGKTLVQVQLVIRHGDRTPASVLPAAGNTQEWDCTLNSLSIASNNLNPQANVHRLFRKTYLPNRNLLPGNCMLGQLTSLGYTQHLSLGDQLRELYVNKYKLLESTLNTSSVYVRSTDVPRTIQSAEALITGLYPPETVAASSVPAIEIHTMDAAMEDLWVNEELCPNLYKIEAQIYNSTAWVQKHAENAPLYAKLQQLLKSTNLPPWGSMADVLAATTCHKFKLPAGIPDSMFHQVFDLASWENNYFWTNSAYGKLGMGFFIKELYSRLTSKINNEDPAKFVLYSAHDSSVGPIIATLGMFDGAWPPYRSHAHFELWRNSTGNYFVQVKYNNKVLRPPGCTDVMCPFSEFQQLLLSRIPNYPADCY